MRVFRKIAAVCLAAAFLLPVSSFAHEGKHKEKREKKVKRDNGKHKGWYKNPRNPHHPDHHQSKPKDAKEETTPRSIIIELPKGTTGQPGPAPKDPKVDTKPAGKG